MTKEQLTHLDNAARNRGHADWDSMCFFYKNHPLKELRLSKLFETISEAMELCSQQVAKEAAADAFDAGRDSFAYEIGDTFEEDEIVFINKTEYLNQKFGQPLPEPKQ